MKKLFRRALICTLAAALIFTVSLLRDQKALETRLIRLHVVGASDTEEDQRQKLLVRDAILGSIGKDLEDAASPEQARAYLQKNLPKLQAIAKTTLEELGNPAPARVTLEKEAFPRRVYDSFTLPAGIYESLRITIGEGKGHNWWCVAFPSLCLPAAGKDLETVAAEGGLSGPLTGAITGEKPYALRFYLLDLLGSWQAQRKSHQ